MRLCEKHSDCIFMSFTNGTLIDEEFAQEMLRVKNFFPVLSVEGDMDATDFRRGGWSLFQSHSGHGYSPREPSSDWNQLLLHFKEHTIDCFR